jgi:LacI family transcriptional regulator
MAKRATITDVAKKAGVSVATVSRYFAGNGYPVSVATGKKIEKATSELEYTPNIVGRMLKTSTSREIGVIIPTIKNPFYPDVLLGIEKTAAERGYQILLCNSLRNPEIEEKYINSLYQKQVGGIIIASSGGYSEYYDKMTRRGMCIVNLDGGAGFPGLEFDYRGGGAMLAGHLKEYGHEKIAFVTSPLTRKSRRDIINGIRDIYGDEELYIITDESEREPEGGIYEYEMGNRLSGEITKTDPEITAVIAVNDITAAGVVRGLKQTGLDVPGDISVAGFDNIELASMIEPALTTIDQPGFETGAEAVDMLLDIMEGREHAKRNLIPRLVKRASTSKIKEGQEDEK